MDSSSGGGFLIVIMVVLDLHCLVLFGDCAMAAMCICFSLFNSWICSVFHCVLSHRVQLETLVDAMGPTVAI